ncbi:MAG: META domain-containing protein [Proteobacteria bacterium]|nr:META domain-containing protein [Pseudomonadota bacterium]
MKHSYLLGSILSAIFIIVGCYDSTQNENSDSGAEADTETDTDSDMDSDTDTDADTDADTDGDSDADGDCNATSLIGLTFIAQEIYVDNAPYELVPDTTLSIQFNQEGHLKALAGCNAIFGSYSIEEGILRIGPDIKTTDVDCEPELNAQDVWVITIFQSSPSVSVRCDGFNLLSETLEGTETQIIFIDKEIATPDLALSAATWEVQSVVDSNSIYSTNWPSPATMEFNLQGLLTFFTGCNNGSATYQVLENEIVLDDVSWTEVGCPNKKSQVLETAVLNVLGAGVPMEREINVDILILDVPNAGLILDGTP